MYCEFLKKNPTAAPGMVLFHPGGFIITPLRSKMRYDKKITDFFSAGKILTAKKIRFVCLIFSSCITTSLKKRIVLLLFAGKF